jgi:sugar phosphate permease
VPVDKAGVGSAVVNTSRQVGGSVGIALMGAIMAGAIGGQATPQAFVDALSTAFVVAAGIAIAGALIAATTIRNHVHTEASDMPSERLSRLSPEGSVR